jgi:homoserine kinase
MTCIRVPATSANLGPGFDTLGMALTLYNQFEAYPANAMSVVISPQTTVDTTGLSLKPKDNLLAQSYAAYFQFRGTPLIPAHLVIEAHIPLSRGLGSSSSAIIAGLVLANSLHPNPLAQEILLPWAIQLEGHPDNVTPALLGGVRLCLSDGSHVALLWPKSWDILLVIPPTPLSTCKAREVLPAMYSQTDSVETLRAMGAWMTALHTQNDLLMRYALTHDRLHQPARSTLIPEFEAVQRAITHTSALGCLISGAGSTLAVWVPEGELTMIGKCLQQDPTLSHCQVITVQPDHKGVQRLS